MKKIIYIFFLISLSCNAQNSIDSLKKYSYFVYAKIDNKNIEGGTCFFVRKKNFLYLVTAAHVLNGWDYVNNTNHEPKFPNNLILRLYRKDNLKAEFIDIDTRLIKSRTKKGSFLNMPDIVFFKIDIPSKYKIYSIESLIEKYTTPNYNPDTVLVCGYPVNDSVNDEYHYVRLPATLGYGRLLVKYSTPLIWDIPTNIDLNDYYIHLEKNIGRGNSGSPVYFLHKDTLSFGGLAFSAFFKEKQVFIVRPEFIKTAIEGLTNE